MTMLPIDPAELVPSSREEILHLRRRLWDRAYVSAREAAERAKADTERKRVASLVAQYRAIPVRGDCVTNLDAILRQVAAQHDMTVAELISHRRAQVYVQPRHEAMYRAAVECPHITYPEIGRRMGGRDHSTVMHGAKKYADRHGLTLPGRLPGPAGATA